jgi:NitT/TauT family transport system permease protein
MKTKCSRLFRKKYVQRIAWILLLMGIWESVVKIGNISPLLMPDLKTIFAALYDAFVNGTLLGQTLTSIGIIALGLVIAFILAILLSLISVNSPVAESFVDTITAIAHPLPGLAIMPLIIIWFGMGTNAVLIVIVHASLWPILTNMKGGILSVPRIYTDVGKNLSMHPFAITWEIRMRAASGYILSGLKIGWARAWRALISTEMVFGAIGKNGGLGWFILKQRTFMDTPGLYAGIVVVSCIGILVEDLFFAKLERRTVKKWGLQSNSPTEEGL